MKKKKMLNEDIYHCFIQEAIDSIRSKHFDEAEAILQHAVALDYSKPEVYNTLGIIMENRGNLVQAQTYYRTALSLDPTYTPAQNNLDRTVGLKVISKRDLGDV